MSKATLLQAIIAAEMYFSGPNDWEEKYDTIFGMYASVIRPLLKEQGLRLEYCDPDTTYQEDVTALMDALRQVKNNLENEVTMTQKRRNEKIQDLCDAMEQWDLDTLMQWAKDQRKELLIAASDDDIQETWEEECNA